MIDPMYGRGLQYLEYKHDPTPTDPHRSTLRPVGEGFFIAWGTDCMCFGQNHESAASYTAAIIETTKGEGKGCHPSHIVFDVHKKKANYGVG